jgi:ABC-type glycerol-3-phosphate transport system permease component
MTFIARWNDFFWLLLFMRSVVPLILISFVLQRFQQNGLALGATKG